ncbi:helix-turn-helix domain-containing protein [Cohnella sp. OV330]|uniref:helix-turn-helix domain-containing protein n=1 Tax=Cohnella sp. OV330 TaxID=1855288 RepID=UPI000AFE5EEB|nr:helix-turn-helix transcriptional regulator [Cohnella sp. OV330]
MFPKRLRELRKRQGLTAKEFGSRFSLAESTISGYETGARKPDLELIEKFADYFEVSVDYLLGRSNSYIDQPGYSNDKNVSNEPEVQFIMRAKQEMSPKAYAKFLKLVEQAKEAFDDEED